MRFDRRVVPLTEVGWLLSQGWKVVSIGNKCLIRPDGNYVMERPKDLRYLEEDEENEL